MLHCFEFLSGTGKDQCQSPTRICQNIHLPELAPSRKIRRLPRGHRAVLSLALDRGSTYHIVNDYFVQYITVVSQFQGQLQNSVYTRIVAMVN